MRLLYNTLLILAAPLLLLALPLLLLRRPEKRQMLLSRLGFGLPSLNRRSGRVIWIHALSVGEVTSALPLVQALRAEMPNHTLVFSATTVSGRKLADTLIAPFVDAVIAFPLDILPVIRHFIKRIAPDLFILVETDFWPNLLFELSSAKIPALLVNGRVSAPSMRSYLRFAFLFRPLFNQFRLLCMQSAADTDNMLRLGIQKEKLRTLGNLKFTSAPPDNRPPSRSLQTIPGRTGDRLLILCGSTHPGEERIILAGFKHLSTNHHHLHLALAPRRIERCRQLVELAEQFGFTTTLLSNPQAPSAPITIVDTIGDLSSLYSLADIAFIGGSLVAEGGHNPLEAARHGCPVLFGPHMEDFAEISTELLANHAAFEVLDQSSLEQTLDQLIRSPDLRRSIGNRARNFLQTRSNVIDSHLALIRDFL